MAVSVVAQHMNTLADPGVEMGSTPPLAPLKMPDQDLGGRWAHSGAGRFEWRAGAARLVAAAVSMGLAGFGGYQMWRVIDGVGGTWLQWGWFGLFLVNFGWISSCAGNAVAGLLAKKTPPLRAGVPRSRHRTVLVMPVHNEEPSVTFANLEAMALGLADGPGADGFELFILSDTRDPDVWARETAAYAILRGRLRDVLPVWYRRRSCQDGHKAGNLRTFVEQWGARYDFMIVLDADSLMAPDTMRRLVETMSVEPGLGILQTVPRLQGGEGLLARVQQFAGAAYGPIMARGLAAWQADAGSYWGHNAIVRVRAFAEACGLPRLPGRAPWGGHVMSHDFVESALLRRKGWQVRIFPDTGGSWETGPPTLLDVAARDRRWVQGNLQHIRFLAAPGWLWPNRVHFLIGIMSYLASPLWLAWIVMGLVITAQASYAPPAYFPETFQLFPDWPRFDAERMTALLLFSIAVLCLPKGVGLFQILRSPRQRAAFGGTGPLLLSAAVELILSALWAPIHMLMQTSQIAAILRGRDAGWSRQRRTATGEIDWGCAWRRHGRHVMLGVGLAWALAWTSPLALAWLSPTLVGWVFAVPLSGFSGSVRLGRALRRNRILTTPEEAAPPPLFQAAAAAAARLRSELDGMGLEMLLRDPAARRRHFGAVSPPPPPPRGRPDLVRLSAAAKIADARSLHEARAWLSREEWIAALSDRALLDTLAARPDIPPPDAPSVRRPAAHPSLQPPPLPCAS